MKNLIRADALHAQLQDKVIVDARFDLKDPDAGRRAYSEGHLPGAVYFDLDKDLSVPPGEHGGRHPLPDTETFARTLGERGIGNNSEVVVYDASGGLFAGRLWWTLRYLGHERVQLLDGGIGAWIASGYPLSTDTPTPTPTTFTPQPRPEMIASLDEVRERSSDSILIDARGADRYRGENETIDKKAGHIPGAINRPFAENLENGTFRSADALKERFSGLEDKEVIVYCGSGVSAAHNVIALEEAGHKTPRLYVGSWSDWSSYDKNPVATDEEA